MFTTIRTPCSLLTVNLALYLVTPLFALPQQSAAKQLNTAVFQPTWAATPVQEVDPSSLNLPANVLKSRSERFANPLLSNLDSDEHKKTGSAVFSLPRPASLYPTTLSDLIVVGVPLNSLSFMAANRSAVYSSLQIKINKILKSKEGNPEMISVLYPGGVIRTERGILQSDIGSGTTPLEIGQEYMIFLSYDAAMSSYHILRAWNLSGGSPVPLNQNGRASSLQNPTKIQTEQDLELHILPAKEAVSH